jgi:hypothetical protein
LTRDRPTTVQEELIAKQKTNPSTTRREGSGQLQEDFVNGVYYAFTSSYWKVEEITRTGNEWQSFVREFGENEHFECRYAKGTGTDIDITTTDPYAITREGVFDKTYCTAPSDTSRSGSMPQSQQTSRNAVWPTDIFGNKAGEQQIAHLIPAGRIFHKLWVNVACAVRGIDRSVALDVKKKAARGYTLSSKKWCRRKKGTRVVHFVSNKIRLQGQAQALDGPNPTCLIVPVMSLEDARKWRGDSYHAICFAGVPQG